MTDNNDLNKFEKYEPLFGYASREEWEEEKALKEAEEEARAKAEAEKARRIAEEEEQKQLEREEKESPIRGIKITGEDGERIVVVHEVRQDHASRKPKNKLKRAWWWIVDKVEFVLMALLASVAATIIFNYFL